MKYLVILLTLLTLCISPILADEMILFGMPGFEGEFTMALPEPFVTPSNQEEEENKKRIITSMNQMGGGQVQVVELFQTSWNSQEANFPTLSITSTPKIESWQGSFTEEMWEKMKQAYQGVADQLFRNMIEENLEKKKGQGMIPLNYSKKDVELLFTSDETSVSFMAEVDLEMDGKKGRAFSYTKVIYSKQCMIMLALTVPTSQGIESLSELVQSIEIK